jgi:tellurite resistance protein TerA
MSIVLEKRGESLLLNLSKEEKEKVRVDINLNWNSQQSPKAGFFNRLFTPSAPDLDLGCMYELTDGSKGVIQPLDKNFGSLSRPPYIFLDKDDRTGAAADGENMVIVRPDTIKRVLIFAMIYQGAQDFRTVEGRLRLRVSNGKDIHIALNNPSDNLTWCAAAMITSTPSGVKVTKEEQYFSWPDKADDYYGFGFTWVQKTK